MPAGVAGGLATALVVITASVVGDRPWWLGLLATTVAGLAAYAIVARCVRRLGGITGDVLGAVVELTLLALLLMITL